MREKLPIDNKWIAAISIGLLLDAGSFPKQCPDWDSLPRANKTWAAWKTTFRSHQLTLKRKQRATGERGDVFGSAAAANTIHGITAATAKPGDLTLPKALAFHEASGTSSSTAINIGLQALNGHIDRMADAATNSGLTLSQLTDANARLASVTSIQYQTIKNLLTDIKCSSSPNPRSSSSGAGASATINQQNIRLIQSAVKNCWIVGGFCYSHGWGVIHQHSSSTCKKKMAGHVDTATCSNPAGPVKTKNQGWDAFT